MQSARLVIAVGTAGAEVTTGEAAHTEKKANMAIEEVRKECMMSVFEAE
jgi:hypothetical protein